LRHPSKLPVSSSYPISRRALQPSAAHSPCQRRPPA
jgi:hypothetical protein